MTEDQDNAGEVVAATVRVALTAAGQLAEQAARRREAALRDAERTSAAQVATLQAQLAAERQAALGSVQEVLRRGDTASVEEFTQAWQQIRSWYDQPAIADRARLSGLFRDRFGVDPNNLTGVLDRQVETSRHDVPAAAAVLVQDTESQREDAERRRAIAGDRVVARPTHPEDPGIDLEVAYAKALSAQSHPLSPGLAAQPPAATAPREKRRAGKRRTSIQMQSPGR